MVYVILKHAQTQAHTHTHKPLHTTFVHYSMFNAWQKVSTKMFVLVKRIKFIQHTHSCLYLPFLFASVCALTLAHTKTFIIWLVRLYTHSTHSDELWMLKNLVVKIIWKAILFHLYFLARAIFLHLVIFFFFLIFMNAKKWKASEWRRYFINIAITFASQLTKYCSRCSNTYTHNSIPRNWENLVLLRPWLC